MILRCNTELRNDHRAQERLSRPGFQLQIAPV